MDEVETRTSEARIEPKTEVGAAHCDVTDAGHNFIAPPMSDENENRIGGLQMEFHSSSDSVIGAQEKMQEDNLNNNEGDGAQVCPVSLEENCLDATNLKKTETPVSCKATVEQSSLRENETSTKQEVENRNGPKVETKGFSEESPASTVDNVFNKSASTVLVEEVLEVNCQQMDPKELQESLFSLFQGASEQSRASKLPLCLHQMAETYFQEEEYEKAVKFIQLERLYHEKLLANLSSIQDQWESKWKMAEPREKAHENFTRELNAEEIAMLTKFCTSHQEPVVPTHKLVAGESFVRSIHVIASKKTEVQAASASPSDTKTHSGVVPGERTKLEQVGMSASSLHAIQAAGLGNDHKKEQQYSGESSEEPHTLLTGVEGRSSSNSLCPGDAVNNDRCLQPEAAKLSEVMLTAAEIILEGEEEEFPTPGTNTARKLSKDTDFVTLDLKPVLVGQGTETGSEQQRAFETDGVTSSAEGKGDSVTHKHQNVENVSSATEWITEMIQELEEDVVEINESQRKNKDLLDMMLNSGFEESFLNLAKHKDSFDLCEETDPELLSCSFSDTESLNDNSISLDELAKRIKIEEITPAEDLVSILKKTYSVEGKELSQSQQKQRKRRVRFQEPEDVFDQDEVSGDSCLLLLLLCLVTVLLSIGGTALYCTFGDMESSVCTDFAANVDLYYTQILQRITEMKHCLSFS
ncbi:consortin isoform X2 [Latimeria chalumnae]|uniref:consortin isoform X2 n=1 Tax=Latimeria chalumnae TaxID=7897 RepID=UPI0003C1A5A8|nr:PREDICTED: consortin [Latimeria chalumnae]|eukprot:XP_005994009.1 PREDICTED: consortin [Latimeria chalumnae]